MVEIVDTLEGRFSVKEEKRENRPEHCEVIRKKEKAKSLPVVLVQHLIERLLAYADHTTLIVVDHILTELFHDLLADRRFAGRRSAANANQKRYILVGAQAFLAADFVHLVGRRSVVQCCALVASRMAMEEEDTLGSNDGFSELKH